MSSTQKSCANRFDVRTSFRVNTLSVYCFFSFFVGVCVCVCLPERITHSLFPGSACTQAGLLRRQSREWSTLQNLHIQIAHVWHTCAKRFDMRSSSTMNTMSVFLCVCVFLLETITHSLLPGSLVFYGRSSCRQVLWLHDSDSYMYMFFCL